MCVFVSLMNQAYMFCLNIMQHAYMYFLNIMQHLFSANGTDVTPLLAFQPAFTCDICFVSYNAPHTSATEAHVPPTRGDSLVLSCCAATTCRACIASQIMQCVYDNRALNITCPGACATEY